MTDSSECERTPISVPKSSPSPIATGGGGTFFEQNVDAFFLSLLLVRGIPPILNDCHVEEVHLQVRHLGWATDDLLIIGTRGAGDRRQLAMQVKIRFVINSTNEDCRKVIFDFWTDFKNNDKFDSDDDRLALVTLRRTDALLKFKGLLDCARASVDGADFARRLGSTGYLSRTATDHAVSIKTIITEMGGEVPSEDDFRRFLSVLDVMSLDLGTSTAESEAWIKSLLKQTSRDPGPDSDLDSGPDPVTGAGITWRQLLELAGTGKATAASYVYSSLPETLRNRHGSIASEKSGISGPRLTHGEISLRGISLPHLKPQDPIEPTPGELIKKVREAAAELVGAWFAHLCLTEKPKIALRSVKLDGDGCETREILKFEQLHQALLENRRIVLEAPGGRGKTTTLVQLAERHRDRGDVAFFVSLPSWVKSNQDILEFIAGMQAFRSRELTATVLSKIHQAVPYSFLLNGWNEIGEGDSDAAARALADLEREYPKAGIIVATRTHHTWPPLSDSLRARLLPLNRRQRAEYLDQLLGNRSSKLISQLEGDRTLDDLTRTPLILSAVADIFLLERPIPKTKVGVLGAVMRLVEESREHQNYLACSPLGGYGRYYLSGLAVQMTTRGSTMLEESEARSAINSVSQSLKSDGQIVLLPDPPQVLNQLCAHHVLERLEYPSVAFKFQHQQFQEWYASQALKKRFLELVEKGDSGADWNFVLEYVNKPGWEEALRMVAEEIGDLNTESPDARKMLKAGEKLVEFGLKVDPVFAAELARLCGRTVWMKIRDAIGERLRSWYQIGSDSHRECALAGMFASGSEDFKDILLPLLTSDNQQVRLGIYRVWSEFHLSILGENWRQAVGTWKEECRADFVGGVADKPWVADIAEEFARTDPSFKVRAIALRSLEWAGATEILSRVLASYDDAVFGKVLRERILYVIPTEMWPRALKTYDVLLQEIEDPKERLRTYLSINKIGGEHALKGAKEALAEWPPGKIADGDDLLVKSAIELIRETDTNWVSQWVADRILNGSLWRGGWETLILELPRPFRLSLIKKFESEGLRSQESDAIASVLAVTADVELAGHVFSQLCLLRVKALSQTPKTGEAFWDIVRRFEGLFRVLQPNIAVAGMLSRLSGEFKLVEYEVAIGLFGSVGVGDSDLRSQLSDEQRQAIRTYLKRGIEIALVQDDYGGHLKAEAAIALARVGNPEDMADLNRLIRADIVRRRKGIEARQRRNVGPLADGATMSWSNRHIQALEHLDLSGAESLLLELLSEPEYERDASRALIRLARVHRPEEQLFRRPDYSAIWEARSGRQEASFNEDRRLRYTSAIKQRMKALTEQRSESSTPERFDGRLKDFAKVIAILDSRDSAEYVMEIMALPGQWDGYTRADALEALLFGGALLRADTALKVINPTINNNIQSGGFRDQQNSFLLQRFLCLLPFFDPPSAGIARLKEILFAMQVPIYELREMLTALGNSRCDEALTLLVELESRYESRLRQIMGEWIDAIAALDTDGSRKVLLSFVDPNMDNFRGEQHLEYHERERLASHIANIARSEPAIREQLYLLCAKQVPPSARILLAEVIDVLGTSEALSAGLNLVSDQKNPSIPYGLSRCLESVFLGKRPYGSAGNAYTIEAIGANEIRESLFEMTISDGDRKRSAWELLGRIESWRLDYGRPNNEPKHPAIGSGKPWPPIEEIRGTLPSEES